MEDKSKKIFDLYLAANPNKYKIVQRDAVRDISMAEFTVLACLDALFRADYYDSQGYDVAKVIRAILLDSLRNRTEKLPISDKIEAMREDILKNPENVRQAAISQMNTFIGFKDGCEELNTILNRYKKLQTQIRTGHKYWGVLGDRLESDLEHTYGTLILGLGLELESGLDLDYDELLITLLIHETDEIIKGDPTVFDGHSQEESLATSKIAEEMVLGDVKNGQRHIARLFAFDRHDTPLTEAEYQIDKLEFDFQIKMYDLMGRFDFEHRPQTPATTSPAVIKIIEDGANSTPEVLYEYDKPKYDSNPFMRMLLEQSRKIQKYPCN